MKLTVKDDSSLGQAVRHHYMGGADWWSAVELAVVWTIMRGCFDITLGAWFCIGWLVFSAAGHWFSKHVRLAMALKEQEQFTRNVPPLKPTMRNGAHWV